MSPLFVVDVETTALFPHEGGIWDVGAVAVRGDEIVAEWQTLVWPGRENLQPRHLDVVQKVSGLEPRDALWMLNDTAVPAALAARIELLRWMYATAGVPAYPSSEAWKQGERARLVATSYNVSFDQSWLDARPWELSYHASAIGKARVAWGPCVMQAATDVMGRAGHLQWHHADQRWRWPKLPLACEYFGVPFEETHRALADARAAAQLAIKLGLTRPAQAEKRYAHQI